MSNHTAKVITVCHVTFIAHIEYRLIEDEECVVFSIMGKRRYSGKEGENGSMFCVQTI